MDEERNNSQAESSVVPCPSPGYQTEIVHEMTRLVSSLPPGVASLKVSRVPDHPEWPEPRFVVIPTNPRAARIEGVAVADDLDLVVGQCQREIFGFGKGGKIGPGCPWTEELRWIWDAVIVGGFVERRYLNSHGQVVGCATRLIVNGQGLVLQSGRRAESLFEKSVVQEFRYEPYFQNVS